MLGSEDIIFEKVYDYYHYGEIKVCIMVPHSPPSSGIAVFLILFIKLVFLAYLKSNMLVWNVSLLYMSFIYVPLASAKAVYFVSIDKDKELFLEV